MAHPVIGGKIGAWCNGSTADFGSVYLGSNPGAPASEETGFAHEAAIVAASGVLYRSVMLVFVSERSGDFYRKE